MILSAVKNRNRMIIELKNKRAYALLFLELNLQQKGSNHYFVPGILKRLLKRSRHPCYQQHVVYLYRMDWHLPQTSKFKSLPTVERV